MHAFFAGTDAAQDEHAQDEIFGQMATFADDVVQEIESFSGSMGKKKVQDGNDEVPGIVGRESARRKPGNDHGPNKRGPPVPQPFHSSGPVRRNGGLFGY